MNATPEPFALEQPETVASVTAGRVGSTALLGSLSLSCEDCMNLMRRYPDKHFDLAIVDPPYGIGADSNAHKNGVKCKANGFREYRQTAWDGSPPPPEYFAELRRVSREQIIWGGTTSHFRRHRAG